MKIVSSNYLISLFAKFLANKKRALYSTSDEILLISCLHTLFDPMQPWAILWPKDSNIFSWLSVLPLARSQFEFLAQKFRDGQQHLGLSMPFIVALRAWSLVGIMTFEMLLVILLLWFRLLLLKASSAQYICLCWLAL